VKKITILLYCLAAAAISTIIYVKTGNIPNQDNRVSVSSTPGNSMSSYFTSKVSSSQENESAAEPESSTDVFIVKAYKGHIAVFQGDDPTPLEEFNTDVSILPKDDQIVLEKGKVLHSIAEVKKLVEDYDS
jgi:hypothetical protein